MINWGKQNDSSKMEIDIRDMLVCAGQAPSAQNMQPWVFMADGYNVSVIPDRRAALQASDPKNRQLFIAMGCAIENMIIAATSRQFEVMQTKIARNGVYTFILERNFRMKADPLYPMIADRRMDRRCYDSTQLTSEHLRALAEVPTEYGARFYITTPNEPMGQVLKKYVLKGWTYTLSSRPMKKEFIESLRFNVKDEFKQRDGLGVRLIPHAIQMPAWIGQKIAKKFLTPERQTVLESKKIEQSSNLVLFCTRTNTIQGWVSLGRTLERFMLVATSLGISFSVMSKPFEIESLATSLKNELQLDGEYPLIALRLGYVSGNRPLKSLRKSLNSILVG